MFTVRGHFHNMPRKMLMMMMTTMVMVMMVMIMMMMVMMMMIMMMMMVRMVRMFIAMFTIRGHFHNLPQGRSSQSRPITIMKYLSIVRMVRN